MPLSGMTVRSLALRELASDSNCLRPEICGLLDPPLTARTIAACLLALFIAFSGPARASGPSPTELPQPLTLSEAINQALQHNYTIQAAGARVRERLGGVEHADRIVPANPGIELESARRDAPGGDSTDIGIRVSQEFWTGGKRSLQREAAQARLDTVRGELDFLRTSVAARTRRAFLQVLLAQEATRTADHVVELTGQLHDYAQRRQQAGEATAMEVNVAAIGLGRARAERVQAQRDRTRARLALAELLAVDPGRDLQVAGELQPARLALPQPDKLAARALQRRHDLAASAQTVVAARKELRLARRELIPNLTIMGFYNREESADIAGVGLSAPLPLLHRYTGEQKIAGARLQQSLIERDALRLQVRREVLQAVADYRAATERVRLMSGQMLEAAEENLQLTRTAFQAGKVGTPAITVAQDNLLNVRRTYLTALEELITAGTELERATGGLVHMAQGAEHDNEESTQ